MDPMGKVTCKVLCNHLLHTYKGMIGYCLKDTRKDHFAHTMFNVFNANVIVGKILHVVYDRTDLKSIVTLTNKNVSKRILVWNKYQERRQLQSQVPHYSHRVGEEWIFFIPMASLIIPMNGKGMEYQQMSCLFKCLTNQSNVTRDDIQEIIVRKNNYVKGCYFDTKDAHDEKTKVL